MNARQIHRTRAALAFGLRLNGASFENIDLILKAGSKEKARHLVAHGRTNSGTDSLRHLVGK